MKMLRPTLLMILLAQPGFSVAEAPEQQPESERQTQLRQLLAQDCSVCHGLLLKGDLGPPLTAKSLAGKSEHALVQIIIEGHEETAMPPWWWMLEEYEARWLVKFIRSIPINGK
ncbi:MAG TPA: cytochrome c [Gammaproteobacteria bacterium]